jgi:Ser/Thr protein kinase RdoA (MazF antagonist)
MGVPTHLELPRLAPPPFAQRIQQAQTDQDSKQQLTAMAADLTRRWDTTRWPQPWSVIHADPSTHNTMRGNGGTYLVDLEGVSIGPRQWDQAVIAVQSDTQADPPSAWEEFRDAYGEDVTTWDGYALLRDIRSLTLCLFALRHAHTSEHAREQADYRLACLMGRHGPRPWKWVAP